MTIDEVAIKQKNNDVKSVKSSKCFDSTYYVLKKLSWEITYKLTLVLNQLTWRTRKSWARFKRGICFASLSQGFFSWNFL